MILFILLVVLMVFIYGVFLIINSKRYCQGKIKNVEDVVKIVFGNKGKVRKKFVLVYCIFYMFRFIVVVVE